MAPGWVFRVRHLCNHLGGGLPGEALVRAPAEVPPRGPARAYCTKRLSLSYRRSCEVSLPGPYSLNLLGVAADVM